MIEALSATGFMLALGSFCGLVLSAASRIFYVYEDPRIEEVEECFAGANCGGCGYAGCYSAAVAVVNGKAAPNVCIAGGTDSAIDTAKVMGMDVGVAEPPSSYIPCSGGDRAEVKYLYQGANSCRAQTMLYGGQRKCEVGCLGLCDCVKACYFNAIRLGPKGLPVIDEARCVGCGACERACPKDLIQVKTQSERLLQFNSLGDCLAPCRQTCPAEINIPLYISQIKNGEYKGAIQTIRERNPFLLSCGRVCPHPCEINCRRGITDEPISINQLKRFVADLELNSGERFPISVAPSTGKRVAVVGGGPAGISCAYFLKRLGHDVTIYEAMPKLGGMLRYGIPEYRLPKKTLDWEIEGILNLGIEHHVNTRYGEDFDLTALIEKKYEAIFMGIGAWKDSSMRAEGEDLDGCYSGIDFLSRLANGEDIPVGRAAAVIGGGNTAIDCTRNLLRKGCDKVSLVYRRTRNEMPANIVEIIAAEEEGVDMMFLAAPIRVTGENNGKVTQLECQKMKLGEPDKSGRCRPVPIEGSEELLPVDMVISAIGQSSTINDLKETAKDKLKELETTRWNTFDVNPETLQTNIPFLFAAGDAATGPDLVVSAIGGGRRAARSIHQYLIGQEVKIEKNELLGKQLIPTTLFEKIDGIIKKPRCGMEELSVADRVKSFDEVDLVITEAVAKNESDRCLFCCLTCYNKDEKKETRAA